MARVITVFPDTGLLRFLLGPKTQAMSQTKLCSTPCGQMLGPVVGGFSGRSWESQFTIALCVHCAHAVQDRPPERGGLV